MNGELNKWWAHINLSKKISHAILTFATICHEHNRQKSLGFVVNKNQN